MSKSPKAKVNKLPGEKVIRVKESSELTEVILETAAGLHRSGIMDDAAYKKIVERHQS